LSLVGEDVFVNVAGGMSIDEPAVDLAVAAAVSSSVRNRPVRPKTVVFGEIGLAGEIRAVTQAARRVREAAQMGFTRCILPRGNIDPRDLPASESCELVGATGVGDALDALFA
jgi:DNA repair protein RadA/Sms